MYYLSTHPSSRAHSVTELRSSLGLTVMTRGYFSSPLEFLAMMKWRPAAWQLMSVISVVQMSPDLASWMTDLSTLF